MVERTAVNRVGESSSLSGSSNAIIVQLEELLSCKQRVAGSIPADGSNGRLGERLNPPDC